MKVMVTGGAGFIGSHLAERLLDEGHEVVVLDNLSTGKAQNIPAEARFSHPVDITHQQRLWDIFDHEKPDAVYHYAARLHAARSIKDPAGDARVNVVGGLNVIRAAIDVGVSRFVYASSCTVYGNAKRLPVREGDSTNPISAYGVSKLALEHYLDIYRDSLPSVVLRYTGIYGPRQRPDGQTGPVAIFTGRALQGKAVTVYGGGTATRDYVYVSDAVDAAYRALTSVRTGIYNIGTGRETSVLELVNALGYSIGREIPIEFAPPRPGDIDRMALNPWKAEECLGWTPRISLSEGIERVIESQKEGEGT